MIRLRINDVHGNDSRAEVELVESGDRPSMDDVLLQAFGDIAEQIERATQEAVDEGQTGSTTHQISVEVIL